jgi:hypothetical protein
MKEGTKPKDESQEESENESKMSLKIKDENSSESGTHNQRTRCRKAENFVHFLNSTKKNVQEEKTNQEILEIFRSNESLYFFLS